MIKNEREYKIVKASLAKFENALSHVAELQKKGAHDPKILKLQETATKSMLSELREQLEEYDQKCTWPQ